MPPGGPRLRPHPGGGPEAEGGAGGVLGEEREGDGGGDEEAWGHVSGPGGGRLH